MEFYEMECIYISLKLSSGGAWRRDKTLYSTAAKDGQAVLAR